MAMKILWESSLKADAMSATAISQWLTSDRARFDGHKGAQLAFTSGSNELRQPIYLVRLEAGRMTPIAEVPRGVASLSNQSMDRPGEGTPDGYCQLASR